MCFAVSHLATLKVKRRIAVCRHCRPATTATGTHIPYMGSHSITCHQAEVTFPPFIPAEAGTRFSDPRGMQGWVDLGGWLEMVYPYTCHPSRTNRARCWLTSLMRPMTPTTTPSRHPKTRKRTCCKISSLQRKASDAHLVQRTSVPTHTDRYIARIYEASYLVKYWFF